MLAESNPIDPLEVLNQLRLLENRKVLTQLPSPYRDISFERLRALVIDWQNQIEIHKELQANSTEYNNRIILNETEQTLYAKNKRNPDNPCHYLKYSQVQKAEKDLYFPHGQTEDLAFITDTNATYIQTVTVTTVQDKTVCLAKHTIPDCISFIPGPAELTPKVLRKRADVVDPSLIIDSKLRPRVTANQPNSVSTPSGKTTKTVVQKAKVDKAKSQVEGNKDTSTPLGDKTVKKQYNPSAPIIQRQRENLKSFIDAQKSKLLQAKKEIPDCTIYIQSKDPEKSIEIPIVEEEDKQSSHSSKSSPTGSISSLSASIEKLIKSPFQKVKRKFKKERMPIMTPEEEQDMMNFLESRVSQLINKHMEETFAKTGRRRQPANPPPEGDPSELSALKSEIESLKAQQQPPRPIASTEKQDIQMLKQNLVEMASYMQKLQEAVEDNKLLPEEKQKLKMMSGPTATFGNPLVYKLNYPQNIISDMTFRGPLTILKAPTVIATVGVFDPDNNPKSDFRDTWERMQNYTRNYDLYEHEYVDMLMALMKGSAATCLTDMIREYHGRLSKILEAIQDIYVPQHTIFDDMDEMNKFTRPAFENIKTTMRRASLLIYKMKPQCSQAAWPERKYHMLLALVKQVIERDTFKHLYAKELECIQAGTQLDIPAIITIVALYEQTHDTIPKREMKLQYNINSMQIINHEQSGTKPVKSLTMAEKPKRSSMKTRSMSKDLISTPKSQNISRGRSADRQTYSKPKTNDNYRSRSASSSYSQNYSQRNSQGERDFQKKSQIDPRQMNRSRPRSQSFNKDKYDSRSQSRERNRSLSRDRPYRPNYSNNKARRYDNKPQNRKPNTNNNNNGNHNGDGSRPYDKKFKHGKNLVTLHFYKCKACPSMHPKGANCDKKDNLTSLNM